MESKVVIIELANTVYFHSWYLCLRKDFSESSLSEETGNCDGKYRIFIN